VKGATGFEDILAVVVLDEILEERGYGLGRVPANHGGVIIAQGVEEGEQGLDLGNVEEGDQKGKDKGRRYPRGEPLPSPEPLHHGDQVGSNTGLGKLGKDEDETLNGARPDTTLLDRKQQLKGLKQHVHVL